MNLYDYFYKIYIKNILFGIIIIECLVALEKIDIKAIKKYIKYW